MSTIALSAATRQSLQTLQQTTALAATNQAHLSSGKKVATALDNPVNFFTSQSLTDRASSLTNLLDGISNSIQTIQSANQGITSATSVVQQMQSLVTQMQTNATTNLPKLQGTVALASAADATATGKSVHDTALAKSLFGANDSTHVGLDATKVDTLSISAGGKTYNVALNSGDTLNDLVNDINKSGIANAQVDSLGQLQITGTGSDALSFSVGKTTAGVYAADASTPPQTNLLTGGAAASSAGGTSAQRSALINQFNALTKQLDQISGDAGFNGTNLLNGDAMKVVFNEKTGTAQSSLTVQGQSMTSKSLGIGQMVDSATAQSGGNYGVQNNTDLQAASDALTNALTSMKSMSSTLGSNLSVVQTRQDFTKSMVNILNTGSDNLTNADMNEEAATSQALSTRQSLGISALSLANQASQGILQLLR